jgi:hypothetical protein
MKISLRKANALQHSINEVIRDLDFNAGVSINEFEDFRTQINTANEQYSTNFDRRESLLNVLFGIRKLVARANVEAGISDKLADVALLEKRIQNSNEVATKNARLSDAVIEGKVEKLKASEDRYSFREGVDTTVFTDINISDARDRVRKFKRQKQRLQDELLELNVRTEIVLDDDSVKVLEGESLI